ncbi:MAG: alpha/beta fold hydrolase, partial [bacterium]
MAEPENLSFTEGGVTTNAVARGSGEPVVLLHGFGQSQATWVLNAEAIAARYRVLAVDMPGFGSSSKIALDSLEAFAANLAGFLGSQGLDSAHIVGHSFGGLIALGLALEHPQKVRSLAVLDPAGFGPTSTDFRKKMAHASTAAEIKDVFNMAFHDPGKYNDAIDRGVQAQLAYRAQAGVMELLAELDKISEAWIVATAARIEEIKAPMLVMWGQEDRATPATNAERARGLPNAEIHLFENAGHAAQIEAAQPFNETLLRFLDSQP